MKIKKWGPALALLGLIAMAGAGLISQPSKPSNFAQLPKADQQHSIASSTASEPRAEEDDTDGDEESHWYDTFVEHTPDWFVALFTLLLTFVTWRLVVSTNKLWAAGERQFRLTHEIAKTQSDETRILQRAYLNVVPHGIRTTVGTAAVIGQVLIRNVGHLPARKVSISVRIGWYPGRVKDAFEDGQVPEQSLVLTVGGEIPRGTGALESGVSRLAVGTGFIYVWGRITYQDGFDTDRWVTFCHRYPCEAKAGIPGTSEGIAAEHARHHTEHNDAN